jgi:hypothetical protein
MNKRIEELAMSTGIYDCITDPYDKLKNGDSYSSVMPDLERFAKLIIFECAATIVKGGQWEGGVVLDKLNEHFGIK